MWTVHAAAEAIRARKLTPVELLDECLARIDRYESKVRAWVFVARDEAREQAEALTRELDRGQYRGPLHGVPVGVKDIFDVFDWPTAAGSKLWANSVARRDSTVVARLRQAGAVLLGKTVTTAYASFDPPPTRNPWNRDRTPGGSSSGSAAAVACGMCLGALASQTGGSITRPAAFCGVASIKPTYGRVSVDGVVPLAPSMDHVGVMAGCVRDVAILYQTIAGWDERDPHCQNRLVHDAVEGINATVSDSDEGPEYRALETTGGLFADRAGEEIRDAMAATIQRLCRDEPTDQAIGHVTPIVLPASFAEVLPRHQTIMAVEAAAFHELRFRRHPDDYPPRIAELIREGLSHSAAEYARTREHQRALTQELKAARFRFLLTPATLGPAPSAETTGNPAFNSPWSYTGLPTVSIPMAWTTDGMPLSLQIVAKPGWETDLLRTAAWCESVLGVERREVPD